MKRIIKLVMILSIILIMYSLYNIVLWYYENKENNIIKEELKEEITIDEEKDIIKIDFDALKKKNSDTVAYLKLNNTNIDYIVVKGEDNGYYLKHNFNKEANRSGWIFMDYHNKLDGSDKNIVIYGHNTKDGSMFGTLRKVVTKEWYTNEENYIISLIIEGETLYYRVFSTYRINVEDYYINTEFKDNNEFNKFVNNLKKRSIYNYNVDVSGEDSILTLSTCTGNGKMRMVLHAKKIMIED